MVFYFKSNVVSPPAIIYMGKDKYENDELIRWGWPEDVWFHVHNLSSAHVYLRLQKGQNINEISKDLINDVAQLVKANSIQGCKMNNIDVVYTQWENLKKTPEMQPGQVVFFCDEDVKKVHVTRKLNEVVNRLNKTKTEEHPDLRLQRGTRDLLEKQERKHEFRIQKLKEKDDLKQQEQIAEMRSYGLLLKPERMTSNRDDGNDSDDFM